jgi:hypothetical protein
MARRAPDLPQEDEPFRLLLAVVPNRIPLEGLTS